MVFKDTTLLQEAYISATQKTVNVPSSSPVIDGEPSPEAPITLSLGGEVPQEGGCSCSDEDQEEDFMAMANLFSLFSNAKKIHHFIESGVTLEPWMQQKIAVCADNLESVMRSVGYDAAKAGVCD